MSQTETNVDASTRTITIAPITRIEGHAKVTIHLDEQSQVEEARLHVTQFRGFEKFCEGRPFPEMPSLTARTCGICPVSHLMASSKACDALMAVTIPPTATKLRRLMNFAQLTQSHALSFFHLSAPDLLLGFDSDPAQRNVIGLIQQHPERARDGVRLRQIGQRIIEMLGGKRVHPAWMVPGGVNAPLTAEARDEMLRLVDDAHVIARRTLDWFKSVVGQFKAEAETLGNFPSLYLGLVDEDGGLEHYDGYLRLIDEHGQILEDRVAADDYTRIVAEAVEPWSYMKFPYYRAWGYPRGLYRVGPLARLNVATHCSTPEADEELKLFKRMSDGPVESSFHFHYARLIEVLFSVERMGQLLRDPEILDPHVRARARGNRNEGIGVAEAPRGTLIHHYKVDDNCLITWANLIIATGHNNLAMNRSVTQVAKHYVDAQRLQEGMLNRVEAVIRCYDPCLSCATHAVGQMPLHVQLVDAAGDVLDEVKR